MSENSYNPLDKYPKPPFKRQRQEWPGLAGEMEPPRTTAKRAIRDPVGSREERRLLPAANSGMGRAAAIAYAREGADVAINYFPSEGPDAQEVISLIKAEGRLGLSLPGDLRSEDFCTKLVADAVKGLGGLDIVVVVHLRKKVATAFRRHIEETPQRVDQIAGAMVLFGRGWREAHFRAPKVTDRSVMLS